jgi:hypothetical protein
MRNILSTSKLSIILLISIYSSISCADGDGSKIFKTWYGSERPGVSAVKFQQYTEICGSCHFPYQPGLLPAVSWKKVMSNMDNHFGESLNLSSIESRTITRYLLDNSAGHVNDEISLNILQSLKYDSIVMRVTKTPYFVKTHSQLNDTDKIKDIGQCNSCHKDAAQGVYDLSLD